MMVGVEPNAVSIGFMKRKPIAPSDALKNIAEKNPVAAICAACSVRLAPNAREM